MYARYMLLLGLEPKKNSPEEVRMKHTIHTIKKKALKKFVTCSTGTKTHTAHDRVLED